MHCPPYFQSQKPLYIAPLGDVPYVALSQVPELLIQRLEQAEKQIVQQEYQVHKLERAVWDLGGQGRPAQYWGLGQQWGHGNEEQKEIRFRFTASGAPICAHCYQLNHMQRECPQRYTESGGGSDQYNGGFGQGTQSFGQGAGRGTLRLDHAPQGFGQEMRREINTMEVMSIEPQEQDGTELDASTNNRKYGTQNQRFGE
uniref:CCHC-type domain-containing protein n=1 Tax=Plectus sambesii TaxID=2011161 RepID=A0A914W5V8_9BILA